MYFLRRKAPVEFSAERVHSVRVSLNAPVLAAHDLPAGPARAAILVQGDARGGWIVTVGVRSNRTGEVAYWAYDGSLTTDTDVSVAFDAAVTFSEALGFLFDDDELPHGAAAAKRWADWLSGDRRSLGLARDAEPATQELMLEELVDEDTQLATPPSGARSNDGFEWEAQPDLLENTAPRREPGRTLAGERRPGAHAGQTRERSPEPAEAPLGLTKFRARPPLGGAEEAAAGSQRVRQPLARVQLVKRRSPEEERRLLLRKLLTSF